MVVRGDEIVHSGLLTKERAAATENFRDYGIALIVFASIALCLYLDADSTLAFQNLLGVCAWVFLFGLLRGESGLVRAQVLVAVVFATVGEHFASPYMEGYIYRFHNVPAYIPPGHGMVYLTAVALARSGFFKRNLKAIRGMVLAAGGGWSVWGLTGAAQGDMVGALLFVVFVLFVLFGRSPGVYLGAFFVTTWLELIGVSHGTWRWVPIDPVLQLPQGNPPSGVAAWYCLVDAVALGFAPAIVQGFNKARAILWRRYFYPEIVPRQLCVPYLQQDYIPALVPVILPY
jgi:hypothetical protein